MEGLALIVDTAWTGEVVGFTVLKARDLPDAHAGRLRYDPRKLHLDLVAALETALRDPGAGPTPDDDAGHQ